MSEYTERYVRFKEESPWGTWTNPVDIIEYCLGFDATVTEERIEEEIISTSRQARSRSWAQREVAGAFDFNPLSPRAFYLALGNTAPDAASPYTIGIGGTLSVPGFTIERGLKGPAVTSYHGYIGAKVDRLELTIESEEDIMCALDWVGRNDTIPSHTWSTIPPSTFSTTGFAYHEACFLWGDRTGSTINIQGCRIEINNNLEPRFSGICDAGDPVAYAIREGMQEISGDFTLLDDGAITTTFLPAVRARAENTICVRIGNATRGTMYIDLNNVALDEFPEDISGMSPFEVTIPFTARASGPGVYDGCTITYETTIAGTITDLPL